VYAGGRLVEFADEARARRLGEGRNVKVVRRRKDRQIVEIRLKDYGSSWKIRAGEGNPRRYSHDHETEHNPPRVWTLRHLPDQARDLFRLSVTDNLRRAA
jgi:hypothetical protein